MQMQLLLDWFYERREDAGVRLTCGQCPCDESGPALGFPGTLSHTQDGRKSKLCKYVFLWGCGGDSLIFIRARCSRCDQHMVALIHHPDLALFLNLPLYCTALHPLIQLALFQAGVFLILFYDWLVELIRSG